MKRIRKSPFPGMDPWLEQRWGDVHTALCVGIRSALQSELPPGLRARAQEDVLLENTEDNQFQTYEPDVTVVEAGDSFEVAEQNSVAIATRSFSVRHIRKPKRRRWVEILDTTDSNRVVTAIEILSPGNKASGHLNEKYREKVIEFLDAGANVVEIDLLRSSRKRLAVPDGAIPDEYVAEYYCCICRARDPERWITFPMPLRERLPVVPIPCRETDADVPLELQPIIERIYLEGAHDDLDYNQPPEPPLSAPNAEWAAGLIANRGGVL